MDPALARPVPFWRQGLAPPPRTSPRRSVDAVPRRAALSSARTHSWTSDSLKGASKASGARSTPPVFPRNGALAIAAHLHDRTLGARDRAAHEEEVLIGDHL